MDFRKVRKIRLISKFRCHNSVNKQLQTHIAQYLTKERQSDNGIWSVNKISQE